MLYGVCVGMERRRRCGWPHGTRTMKMWCTPVRHASISTACPDASSSPCGAYAEHRDGWHLTVPVYCVVGAGRLPVESWGPATRAAQHPARCMLLVACCVCCLLHVATACCNVGADDCQWKVWDLRHAQRKPVFTCKPVAMGVTAVRIRSTSPSLAHPSRSRTHGRGTRLRPRTDGR